jgi:hypothetical protein
MTSSHLAAPARRAMCWFLTYEGRSMNRRSALVRVSAALVGMLSSTAWAQAYPSNQSSW